jgi:hypothetical protein
MLEIMRSSSKTILIGIASALLPLIPCVATPTPEGAPAPVLVQATLTAPGSRPFYLKAVITERADPASKTEVEIYWIAPDKWRRTIQSQTEFSQTSIMNGVRVFEDNSDDYFPLWSQTLVTAMVDPNSVLDAFRPGDRLITKANGGADESGKICFSPPSKMCFIGRSGLQESVGAAGHSVDFTSYKDFHGKRVARLLVYHVDPGDSYRAEVTELRDLKNPDQNLFSIPETTTDSQLTRSLILSEAELRSMALQSTEIIWPQVLDGPVTGKTSYYVSIKRSGQVAEVLPLSVQAERADGSARRQIMQWKFKPAIQSEVPVQAEGILTFDFNTRAYGPPNPLTNEESRRLASTIVEPVFSPGVAASGSTYTYWLAVDDAGNVIEMIAGDGPQELNKPCLEAIRQWRFRPMVENGKPVPYRAQVTFRVP